MQSASPPHEFVLRGRSAPRARTGVLLVHGLTGTPNEMRLLAQGPARARASRSTRCSWPATAAAWPTWSPPAGPTGRPACEAGAERLRRGGSTAWSSAGCRWARCSRSRWPQRRPERIAGVCALSTIFRYDGWSMPGHTRLAFLLPSGRPA